MVDRAATQSSEDGFRALEALLEHYRPALVAHLVYIKKVSQDKAHDYVQGFITGKILQGELLARAERSKGKFRTFLLTAFDRYILNEIGKQNAQKRMPGEGLSL
jgi:DNA-directed RNA polymerase specialized sigma24 family protein